MLRGAERTGNANIGQLSVIKQYDEAEDCLLLDGNGTLFTLSEGYFAILFPDDIHMSEITVKKPEALKKAVLKVRI